ncbi:MAG: FmdB family zinc ribbon protein [Usitatibacter sp.]
MPIYEYRCSSCGHEQEFLQKLSDPPMTVCTACGKPALSKMLTAAGFQLKGSGWYATDFKNTGSAPAKSNARSGTKSESKSDAPAPGEGPHSGGSKPAGESASSGETSSCTGSKSSTESKSDAAPKPSTESKPSS